MNQRLDRNYYELLDLKPGATRQEIEAAYARVRKIYADGSVAAYSLFTEDEREALLKQVDTAYETLRDPSKKTEYDSHLIFPYSGGETPEIDMDSFGAVAPASHPAGEQAHEFETTMHQVRFRHHIASMENGDPNAAEQYRMLFANLEQISLKNSYKTFAVTSAVKGEGKSVTSINLSYIMAREFKKKVLLVDCDLRNPTISTHFVNGGKAHSIEDVMKRTVAPEAAIKNVEGTSMYVLASDVRSARSAEILGAQRLKALCDRLKTEFDYIILDCPPIIPIVDMQIISKQVDGVVLVVRAGKTPKDIVFKALKSLSDTSVVGIVLNGTDTIFNKYYY